VVRIPTAHTAAVDPTGARGVTAPRSTWCSTSTSAKAAASRPEPDIEAGDAPAAVASAEAGGVPGERLGDAIDDRRQILIKDQSSHSYRFQGQQTLDGKSQLS
jgi:hypothetical protein